MWSVSFFSRQTNYSAWWPRSPISEHSDKACGFLEWQEANEVVSAILAKQARVPTMETSEASGAHTLPGRPVDRLNNLVDWWVWVLHGALERSLAQHPQDCDTATVMPWTGHAA